MTQGADLEHVALEKDLVLIIDMGGKQTGGCQATIGKPNMVSGCIRRGLNYKSKEVVFTLQELCEASSIILCTVWFTASNKGHSCHRKGSSLSDYTDSKDNYTKL